MIAGVSIWLPAPNPYRGVQLATFRQSVHAAAESAREDGPGRDISTPPAGSDAGARPCSPAGSEGLLATGV